MRSVRLDGSPTTSALDRRTPCGCWPEEPEAVLACQGGGPGARQLNAPRESPPDKRWQARSGCCLARRLSLLLSPSIPAVPEASPRVRLIFFLSESVQHARYDCGVHGKAAHWTRTGDSGLSGSPRTPPTTRVTGSRASLPRSDGGRHRGARGGGQRVTGLGGEAGESQGGPGVDRRRRRVRLWRVADSQLSGRLA